MFAKFASKTTLALIVFATLLMIVPLGMVIAQGRPGGWTKYATNPVFDVGTTGAWDDKEVFDPLVLFDGTRYRMWYTGDQGGNPRRLGYATSTDGLSWARYVGNPVLDVGASGSWDADGARWAAVISDTGVLKMWYTGRDASGLNRIGYATSSDGITWAKYIGNPVLGLGSTGSWDESQVIGPTVIKDGGVFKMWYRGQGSDGRTNIGYATSPDGLAWTKYSGNPVLPSSPGGSWDYWVDAPHVTFDGSVYQLWYSGCNFSGTACETGYATSTDGIHWAKQGRVVQQGPDGSFDRYSSDWSTVLLMGNAFKMWYSGLDANNSYRIGYASAPSLVLTRTVYLPLVLRNSSACSPTWFDDFSDYHTGWYIANDSTHTFAYTGGEYQLLGKNTNWYLISTPGVQMSDGVIAVSMRFASATGGAGDNGGIMFGQTLDNQQNFYRFLVRRDGGYGIQRHDASSGWHDLIGGTAAGYLPYPATNRLKVIRNGSAITAYLNGQFLATVSDSTYLGSLRVGLSAGSGTNSADLRFDDYGVYPLSCSDQVAADSDVEP